MADSSKAAMPAIMAIIAKKKAGAASEPDGDEGSQQSHQDEVTAASDVLTAIQDGDPEALVTALKSFVEICKE